MVKAKTKAASQPSHPEGGVEQIVREDRKGEDSRGGDNKGENNRKEERLG